MLSCIKVSNPIYVEIPMLQGGAEALSEGFQGCQLTPLEFWRLAQLTSNFSLFVGEKSD